MQFGTCEGNNISFSVHAIMWLGHPHIPFLVFTMMTQSDWSSMSPVESPAYEVYHERAC